jgi:hypothetical protein
MAFKHPCFISYPHNAGKSVDTFVTLLKEELANVFARFVPGKIITDHDFLTGADFNKAIAQAICESACLLVIYMPVYRRKVFCLQEYTAMEGLQVARYEALQQDLSARFGMILPLVYTGEEDKIPGWISQHINYKNISEFTIAGPEAVFDQRDFKVWLNKIANMVDSLYDAFEELPVHPCVTCGDYDLPDEQHPNVKAKLSIPKAATESFR